MSAQNIELTRAPDADDYHEVQDLAAQDCECTKTMKADLEHGDETICRPCAARQVINGLNKSGG